MTQELDQHPSTPPRMEVFNGEDGYEQRYYIDIVKAHVEPPLSKFQCICCAEGIVHYDRGTLETFGSVRHIIINSVEAYRCDTCEFSAHLDPIEQELRDLISQAEISYNSSLQ